MNPPHPDTGGPRTLPPPPPPPPRSSRHAPLFTTAPASFLRGSGSVSLSAGSEDPNSNPNHSAPLPPSFLPYRPGHGQSPSSSSSSYYPPGTSHTDTSKRRRGRQATACRECNRRKQRCDGDMPCGTCIRRGMQDACVYPEGSDTSWNAHAEMARDARERKKSRRERASQKGSSDMGGRHRPNSDSGMDHDYERSEMSASDERVRGSSVPGVASSRLGETGSPAKPIVPSHQTEYTYPSLASHPVSSERHNPLSVHSNSNPSSSATPRRHISPSQSPEASLGNRFWRSHTDIRAGYGTQTGTTISKGSGSSSESEHLMEENEAQGAGSMRVHSGPWPNAKGEKTFFGTSHFGPQLAAKVIRSMPTVPLSDVRHAPSRGMSRLDGVKPYTLESQTRDLVSYLPPREECDRYVRRFFDRYNSHNDIVYQPDFMVAYHTFWNDYNTKETSEVDLRHLSLLLIMLAFGVLLDHDPSEKGHRLETINEMGLSAEHTATISAMLDDLKAQTMSLPDREEKSSRWSWAAKRALMESSSFFGESIDTVRAGLLIALYLNVCRRVPEAWTAIGTAIRAAQAQGLHVDGSSWKGMSIKEAELRRRLWAQLYIVDRSISLFLGRPVCIQDGQFNTREPANMHDEELDMPSVFPRAVNLPTKTTFLILHYRLAKIIGQVQLTCFNLNPRRYADVQACEQSFRAFKDSLPPHFKLDREGTETSLDWREGYQWLSTQRQTLNSKYHLARISLHRPYLIRSLSKAKGNRPNPYMESCEALLSSAIADLQLRISFNELDPLDRFKWMTVASGFNSATILGIICHMGYQDPRYLPGQLRVLLQEYISLEEKTIRRDEALETELAVLRLMEDKALSREGRDRGNRQRHQRNAPSVSSALGLRYGLEAAQVQGHGNGNGNGQGMMGPPTESGATNVQTHQYLTPPSIPTASNGVNREAHRPLPLLRHNSRSLMDPPETPSYGTSNQLPVDGVPNTWPHSGSNSHVGSSDSQPGSAEQSYQSNRNPSPIPSSASARSVSHSHASVPPPLPPVSVTIPGETYSEPPAPSSATPTALSNPGAGFVSYGSNSVSTASGGASAGAGTKANNEWLMPSDWDPTASGLPDSSDPRAWQMLLGMDWSLTEMESGEAAVVGPDGVWRNVTYVDEEG